MMRPEYRSTRRAHASGILDTTSRASARSSMCGVCMVLPGRTRGECAIIADIMRATQRRHAISSLAVMLAAAAFIVACGSDNTDEILRLVPTVSPDLAANLHAGDDRELAEFGRK